MEIVERTKTPDGIEILLEDWTDNNTSEYPNLYGLVIAAYPVAKRSGKYKWVESGQKFRLHISMNGYSGYTNEDVKVDFESLKSGKKKLEDLASHFWNGKKDMWYLGMDVDYIER